MGAWHDNKKSLKALHEKRKTNEQLTAENKQLREQLAAAEEELINTQLALCDVYEVLIGGEA